jgi:hypothetical protein
MLRHVIAIMDAHVILMAFLPMVFAGLFFCFQLERAIMAAILSLMV